MASATKHWMKLENRFRVGRMLWRQGKRVNPNELQTQDGRRNLLVFKGAEPAVPQKRPATCGPGAQPLYCQTGFEFVNTQGEDQRRKP
jgi:hypothetical protein